MEENLLMHPENSTVIATELNLSPSQVGAVIGLLGEGATLPFIARVITSYSIHYTKLYDVTPTVEPKVVVVVLVLAVVSLLLLQPARARVNNAADTATAVLRKNMVIAPQKIHGYMHWKQLGLCRGEEHDVCHIVITSYSIHYTKLYDVYT